MKIRVWSATVNLDKGGRFEISCTETVGLSEQRDVRGKEADGPRFEDWIVKDAYRARNDWAPGHLSNLTSHPITLQPQRPYLLPSNIPSLFSLNVFALAVFSALYEKVINSIVSCQVKEPPSTKVYRVQTT